MSFFGMPLKLALRASTKLSLSGLPFLVRSFAYCRIRSFFASSGGVDAKKRSFVCVALVDLAGDQSGAHVWVQCITFVANDPPAPDEDVAVDLHHIFARRHFPHSIIQ